MVSINYREKSYEEIFLGMLQESLKQGLISKQDEFEKYIANKEDIENFYVMLESVHSEVIQSVYKDITLVYNSTDIDLCSSVDLDRLGKLVGIPRASATKAQVEVTLSFTKAQSTNITIPKGITVVSKKEGKYYKSIEQVTLLSGEKEVKVQAEATTPGINGKIASHALNKVESDLSSLIEGSVKCDNENSSSGGEEAQTDDEYRETLKNWAEIHEKGSYWSYKNYFRNKDGVDSWNIIPNWDGSGTIKVIIDEGTDYLRKQVYTELQERIACIDDDVLVIGADKKYIDIDIKISIDLDEVLPASQTEKDKVAGLVKNYIKIFIDGGFDSKGNYQKPLGIGEDFVVSKLVHYLHNQVIDLKDVVINNPIDYVSINDEEVATSRNINIEVL